MHTGSLFGEAPTGQAVNVPMAALHCVPSGEIVQFASATTPAAGATSWVGSIQAVGANRQHDPTRKGSR